MSARAPAFARAGATLGLVVSLDQATKAAIVASLDRGERLALMPGLDLTNVRNTGIAFGALAGAGGLIVPLTVLALALLAAYFARHAGARLLWLPVGMIGGGALGNLADRAREGAVIDFLDPVAWPAFNVADSAIVLGVAGLLLMLEWDGSTEGSNRRHRPLTGEPKATAAPEEASQAEAGPLPRREG